MRITSRLMVQRKGFWFKTIWKKKSKFKIMAEANHVPPALTEAGIQPVDPLEEIKTKRATKVWVPPNDPRFMFPPREEDHQDYHPIKAYTVSNNVRMWEGVRQAQVLTNTLVTERLPDCILSKADELYSTEHDHIMQRAILQSNLWDNAREKLPERKKPDDISIWNYKAEKGIPQRRINTSLLRTITQKSAILLAKNGLQHTLSRRLVQDHSMNSYIEYDGKKIYATCDAKFLLTSGLPVPSYVDSEQVKESKHGELPDLFPVAPTVDLEPSHIYKEKANLGHSPQFKFRRHHTLFLDYPKEWTMEMRHCNALMMSYVHSSAIAREYNLTKTLISEPVCVQTVHTDGELFGYTCFQLNTLVSSTEAATMSYASRRNLAWVDSDLMYEKIFPRRTMLRDTQYRAYNSEVFKKILALFAH